MKIFDLIAELSKIAKENSEADVYIDATVNDYRGPHRYDDLEPGLISMNADGKSIYIEAE